MFSIGELAKQVEIKITTIRYYEQIGLIKEPMRSLGNQRRYNEAHIKQLRFAKHARELGFTLEAISSLMEMEATAKNDCGKIDQIAKQHLQHVKDKIVLLIKLQTELERMVSGCDNKCYVIESLSDHHLCTTEHKLTVLEDSKAR
ncbi:hypothetical protein GPUN_1673 [Glaciecola punicea ACAM 611]|jgi:DNA-binding transcriptional MerR regulator|uniref:HTH merR-type domain-containing protein n=1 Tax=Glaciecola punicea ACAM 611 TaxID=1121923 RepID=H5TBW2_9ALTE|nr:helix-turn-helix domain-containing protein [Glaciecola punicea]GAB55789.1 hypothetical protein GPUN_1673 [Glaciecola punicea ACAM 611]